VIARPVFVLGLAVAIVSTVVSAGAVAATPRDHAAQAWNILPPGQAGGVAFTRNSTDQAALYDSLTPLQDRVTATTLAKTFKGATLGLGGARAVRTERPRAGLVIRRDRWGVPHIEGKTDRDVAFGAGWVTAQDRQLIMELLRGPGRIAALDAPGVDAFALALSGKTFVPSAATEAKLTQQFALLQRSGPAGARIVRVIDAYIAGINAWYRKAGLQLQPWRRADVVAVAGLIGSVFGAGGGDEVRRSAFLSALQRRLGGENGRRVWEDLRLRDDPEARTAVERPFAYPSAPSTELGNVIVDAGSLRSPSDPLAQPAPRPSLAMSNALLVGARRSTTGRPLAVMGPQVGYYYPELLLELDLHGGGYDARGAAFPGISFAVLLGRGADYAWSATSAGSDLVDEYVEPLCDDSETRYQYRGECRAMTTFAAGTIKGVPGAPERELVYRETVHGPVTAYATVAGRRVAISRKRSTRDRELLAAPFFFGLSTGAVRSSADFFRLASTMELSFNWHYVDDRDIAVITTGRLPVRPPTVDSGLPTKGTGEFEWSGFVPPRGHPQQVNPRSGMILNWNNKPAPGFTAADNEWSYGSVQRVDLLWAAAQRRRKHSLASLVGAMNLAATQDLRLVRVWPAIRAALARGNAPSARAGLAVQAVDDWLAAGGSRLDRDLDGAIDAPGAAVLDASWQPLGDAVLEPVLGPLVADLAAFHAADDAAGPSGSAYLSGWYSYIDKDLRALLGRQVRGPLRTRFCGHGNLAVCAISLWAAIDGATAALEGAQGADVSAWRADATKERIRFAPGILPATMRWTNRPTFQQAISFSTHR